MSFKILIVGAGAVGGYFGARLAAAGRDVTFLVRPKRAEALHGQGLQVKSPLGDLTLQPKLAPAEDLSGPFDLIFLSVKGYALEAAMQDLAPAVGPGSMILPVLRLRRIHLRTLVHRQPVEALSHVSDPGRQPYSSARSQIRSPNFVPRHSRFRSVPGGTRSQTGQTRRETGC